MKISCLKLISKSVPFVLHIGRALFTKYVEPHGLPEARKALSGCLVMKSLQSRLKKDIGKINRDALGYNPDE
jgi:hypothetical protein